MASLKNLFASGSLVGRLFGAASAPSVHRQHKLHSTFPFFSQQFQKCYYSRNYGEDDMNFSHMTDEQLADNSTIPGWHLIHSPPRRFPRGSFVGRVVSNKMQKTINVEVIRYRVVPIIRKRVQYKRKFMAHDEHEVAGKGDMVMITPCHRISRHKHFMLREIVKKKGQI